MPDVFISHSSRDKHIAEATCAVLENHGIRCWIAPRDIPPGREWGEAILGGIGESRVMVLILSASANSSSQVRREVERAVHRGAVIIPMRIENVLPQKSLEFFLSAAHWLDAFTPPLQKHLDKLANTIASLLEIPLPAEENRNPLLLSKGKRLISSKRLLWSLGALATIVLFWLVVANWLSAPHSYRTSTALSHSVSEHSPSAENIESTEHREYLRLKARERDREWSELPPVDSAEYLMQKMKAIRFPQVTFNGATVEEAVEYLRVKSHDLDQSSDSSRKGVSIIVKTGDIPSTAQISLDLRDVPMEEALRYITELAGMKFTVKPYAVLVVPLSEDTSEMITRTYHVRPDFLSDDVYLSVSPAPADPFAKRSSVSSYTRASSRDVLVGNGIPFPDGSSAVFNPVTSDLMVRNTASNLDMVETYLDSIESRYPVAERRHYSTGLR